MRWIEDIKRYAPKNIIQILVGNKKDLSEEREVKYDEARALGDYYDIKEVLETSAKVWFKWSHEYSKFLLQNVMCTKITAGDDKNVYS